MVTINKGGTVNINFGGIDVTEYTAEAKKAIPGAYAKVAEMLQSPAATNKLVLVSGVTTDSTMGMVSNPVSKYSVTVEAVQMWTVIDNTTYTITVNKEGDVVNFT